MRLSPTSDCRSCGSPVFWARTVNGKMMPLDPDPTPGGNVVFSGPGVRIVQQTTRGPDERYTSHFATCPSAAKHRKK